MISGIFHQGSGLGNQLHRYVATRVLALDKRYRFGMIRPDLFKGHSFMNLNMGEKTDRDTMIDPSGKVNIDTHFDDTKEFEEHTNYYNPEFNFIKDNTVIDGEFQSIQYFGHHLDLVDEWLKVDPMDMDYETCVIGFRGGEFALFPELFLPHSYWKEAIDIMVDKGVKKFEIHTDDEPLAKEFFKNWDTPIVHDIGINWRSMRYAKYAIIANSSFYILPRLLSGGITIAPKGWARRNIGEWSRPDNYYSAFQYV